MLKLTNLKCENLKSPFGMDVKKPRFSWILESTCTDVMQAAWRIQVNTEGSLVWDSQRVTSSDSIEVMYAGPDLEPMKEYLWEVTVCDNQGEEASEKSSFFTGRLDTPWKASWVEPEQIPTAKSMVDPSKTGDLQVKERTLDDYEDFRPVQYLRILFGVEKPVSRAVVYATAHGIYHLSVNGEAADDRLYAPEISAYEKRLQYQCYDVTKKLVSGNNVFGIQIADGWWTGRVGTSGDSCQYGDKLGLLLECRIEYEDGTIGYVCSDDAVSTTGPLLAADLFVGEKYDARLELPGWDQAGMDAAELAEWKPVKKAAYGTENLVAQYGNPVRIIKSFQPKKVIRTPKGETVLDLGQNIAGFLSFTVKAPEGTVISLEHAEILDQEGNFYNNILGFNKDQKIFYITKEGTQSYHPVFSYHGFRYVRIEGWPGTPEISDFTAHVVSSDNEDIGFFETSDEKLNRLQQNIWWSQVANTVSIPTDCPQREKAGWTGDIMAYSPTMCYLRDSNAFLTRWLRECQAEQKEDGEIPTVVPFLQAYKDMNQFMGSDTSCGWGDAIVVVPWSIYQAYGNRKVLEENYGAMKKWMHYVQHCAETEFREGYEEFDEARKERQKYLWNTGFHYGDWLVPSMVLNNVDGAAMINTAYATKDIVAPAYYAFNTSLMSKIAEATGHMEDAAYYRELNRKIRKAFEEEYIHEDGSIESDLQGIYVLALKNNLVSDELRPKVTAKLRQKIEDNGNRLDTGFLSVPFLMDVLTQNGCKDLAYKLLYQNKCPSWLYEVEHGATTMWESWGAISETGEVSTYSYNHYAFGCVGDWMYREIAGLQAAKAGYKAIRVAPSYDCGLESVTASEKTPYGTLSAEWKKQGDAIILKVRIPANTTAVIVAPDGSEQKKGSGNYEFEFHS